MPYIGRAPTSTATKIEDADQDTKIQVEESSDEDTIRFDIAGAEDFTMTANTFTVLSGSTLAVASGATIANSGTATGFADLTAIADGSVSAPSLANSGDTNTGIYWPGADQLGLTTAGAAAMLIDATGAITKPLQPCFLARPTSNQNNLTTDSLLDIAFGTERFDLGSDFSTPSFTAPVTGKYLATIDLRLASIDIDANYVHMYLTTSNYDYVSTIMDFGGMSGDPAYWTLSFSAIVDMDASDTAKVQVYQNSGAAQMDVQTDSYFSMGLFAQKGTNYDSYTYS